MPRSRGSPSSGSVVITQRLVGRRIRSRTSVANQESAANPRILQEARVRPRRRDDEIGTEAARIEKAAGKGLCKASSDAVVSR